MATSATDAPADPAGAQQQPSGAASSGIVSQVKDQAGKLTDLGMAKAAEFADTKKQGAVQQVDAIVQVIRELGDGASESMGPGAANLIGRGGDAVEAFARTLEESSVEDVLGHGREAIVRHPGAALAVAALAGFAGGRILKGAMARSSASTTGKRKELVA